MGDTFEYTKNLSCVESSIIKNQPHDLGRVGIYKKKKNLFARYL